MSTSTSSDPESGAQIGIRADLRNSVNPLPQTNDGILTATYTAPTGTTSGTVDPGKWNFDIDIDLRNTTGPLTLSDFTAILTVTNPGGAVTTRPTSAPSAIPPTGSWYSPSENPGFGYLAGVFPGYNPNTPGTYGFDLTLTPTSSAVGSDVPRGEDERRRRRPGAVHARRRGDRVGLPGGGRLASPSGPDGLIAARWKTCRPAHLRGSTSELRRPDPARARRELNRGSTPSSGALACGSRRQRHNARSGSSTEASRIGEMDAIPGVGGQILAVHPHCGHPAGSFSRHTSAVKKCRCQ